MSRPRPRIGSTVRLPVLGGELDEYSCLMLLADPSDISRPSNIGDTVEGESINSPPAHVVWTNERLGSGNTYSATTAGTSNYDSATRDPTMGNTMQARDNYGSTNTGLGGSSGFSDPTRMGSGMNGTYVSARLSTLPNF